MSSSITTPSSLKIAPASLRSLSDSLTVLLYGSVVALSAPRSRGFYSCEERRSILTFVRSQHIVRPTYVAGSTFQTGVLEVRARQLLVAQEQEARHAQDRPLQVLQMVQGSYQAQRGQEIRLRSLVGSSRAPYTHSRRVHSSMVEQRSPKPLT